MSQSTINCSSITTAEFDKIYDDIYQAYQLEILKEQENDIGLMANVFEQEKCGFKSLEEVRAYQAQCDINIAKQKIRELQEETEKQEAIIRNAEKAIQKHKRLVQVETTNKLGRPARSENRERIARKFTSQWVTSLKDALEAKSCGKLEELVSSTSERNWRRWLKGDAIPTYTTLEKLLDAKIRYGKYSGDALSKVPVTPTHNDLLILLRFI